MSIISSAANALADSPLSINTSTPSAPKAENSAFEEHLAAAKRREELIEKTNDAVMRTKPEPVDPAEEFLAFMEKTPAERMRELILKQMGLTEEQLEAMPPEERRKIEMKIAELIEAKLKEQTEDKLEEVTLKAKLKQLQQQAPALVVSSGHETEAEQLLGQINCAMARNEDER